MDEQPSANILSYGKAACLPRRPFLAWWGFLPAIFFVIVGSRYGWADGQAFATEPRYAICCLIGSLVGGFIFSILPLNVA